MFVVLIRDKQLYDVIGDACKIKHVTRKSGTRTLVNNNAKEKGKNSFVHLLYSRNPFLVKVVISVGTFLTRLVPRNNSCDAKLRKYRYEYINDDAVSKLLVQTGFGTHLLHTSNVFFAYTH